MRPITLHGYFRSSASWRVRIALHLKGVPHDQVAVSLKKGEQHGAALMGINPQGLVPVLEIDGLVLTQSLAICEYLDETRPEPPLLPADPAGRAQVRALAQAIACDTHPVQNLRVLKAVQALGHTAAEAQAWARRVCEEGLGAYNALVARTACRFSHGDAPTLADIMLVPQMANARRFGADMRWPRLEEIERECLALDAFADTAPERQPDAES